MAGEELNGQVAADLDRLEAGAADASGDFIPGPAPAGAADDLSSVDLCTLFLTQLFVVISARRGAHWALSPEESANLGSAAGRVLDKYVPNMNAGPEAALLLLCAMAVMPRLALDRQVAQERAAAAVVGGADGGQPGHVAPES